jgi:hypothetical protein
MTRALSILILGFLATPAWAGNLQLTSIQPVPQAKGSKQSIEISCTDDGACTIFENNQAVGLSEVSTEAARDVQTGKIRISFRGPAKR